ncbi:MAG: 2-hydroxyacid dehydrogenase, partial [Verrucomicrobia bacterium]|nr:2-hydroxyacid dehydrogenase [Verrucomicrobiota bacterium]
MKTEKPFVAVYDAKSYDREYLSQAIGADELHWYFHEFRLEPETASSSGGASVVSVFVNDVVNRDVLKRLAGIGIRLVALRCAGFNNVDLESARELGIAVTRVPSYSPHAVAEHTIALILTLNRKIHRAFNRVREFNFSLRGLEGFDLCGKTAGILGTGKIGRLVGQILRGFQMRVLAYDPYPNRDWAARNEIEYVEIRALMEESNIITLHAPLTPQTDRIINHETLALMKSGVIIANTSRGRLIHTQALIKALK